MKSNKTGNKVEFENNDKKDKKNILIVEDDEKLARVLSRQLKENDFRVSCACSFTEFSETFEEEKFNLVLLDLGLPDSSGLKTYEEVHKVVSDIPIVVLTGLDDEKVAVEAVKKGAQDYLVKGEVDNRTLLRSLDYAIERSKLLYRLKKLQELVLQSERIKVLVETAGAAAHEINQPLTSIFGMVEFLRKNLDVDAPEQKKLDIIMESACEIRDIIKKMGRVKEYVTKPYLNGVDIVDFDEASKD